MATLTVRGRAAVPGVPDEATVALELSARHQSADEAYEEVAGRNETLTALCEELGIAAGARSTAGLVVGPHVEYVDGREQHRGYRAVNRVHVRLDDSAVVARLVQGAVTRAGARVHAEARRLAAEDARGRAETYATALRVRLGSIERVAEPDERGVGPLPGPRTFAAMEAAQVIDVQPGEQLVAAAVDVTFVLEQD
jgi:uncharacterized protein YggE